jgi:protein SCO1
MDSHSSRSNTITHTISEYFTGWRFPILTIAVLLLFNLMMIIFLAIPSGDTAIGEFARDFKTWCFNYDPATGRMDWFYVAVMISQPVLLSGIVYFIWRDQILQGWQLHRRAVVQVVVFSLTVVLAMGIGFTLMVSEESYAGDYPFPAERLRTSITPPAFSLVNQDGDQITLEELRGRVVVVTGVYATCSGACPVIMTELKRVTDRLSADELDHLSIVAITLDPVNDVREKLESMAYRHGVSAPLYHLVNGDVEHVNDTLDRFSISRTPNDKTGEIDHVNLYVLIDRQGKIAYRLTLSERTNEWLTTALKVLLADGNVAIAQSSAP